MNQEEQGKKTGPVITDAAVKEVIPAKPTALSDEDLDKVAGGLGGLGPLGWTLIGLGVANNKQTDNKQTK